MELTEFIKTSLVQIIRGISEAAKEIQDESLQSKAFINPTQSKFSHADLNNVSFDIAVTVQENTETTGSGSIKVLGVKAGGGVDKTSLNTSFSRISFEVPVAFPSTAKDRY